MADVVRVLQALADDRFEAARRLPRRERAAAAEAGVDWDRRRYRVEACGKIQPVRMACAQGHRWTIREGACGLRICPHCQGRAAAGMRDRIVGALVGQEGPLRLVTLSVRSKGPGMLESVLADVESAWDRLRRSRWWRRRVRGAVAVFEVTCGQAGWHPHVHVVTFGSYLPWRELLREWVRCSRGAGEHVDVRGSGSNTRAAAVAYLSKYQSKGWDLSQFSDEQAFELVAAWWRFRSLRMYGCCFGLGVPERFVVASRGCCPSCGLPGFVVPCLTRRPGSETLPGP